MFHRISMFYHRICKQCLLYNQHAHTFWINWPVQCIACLLCKTDEGLEIYKLCQMFNMSRMLYSTCECLICIYPWCMPKCTNHELHISLSFCSAQTVMNQPREIQWQAYNPPNIQKKTEKILLHNFTTFGLNYIW